MATFKELLSLSKDQIAAQELEARVSYVRGQGVTTISQMEASVERLKASHAQLVRMENVSFEELLENRLELAQVSADLVVAKQLSEELFG